MELLGQNNVADHQRKVVCISQDSFYKDLDVVGKARAAKGLHNFDHPGECFERYEPIFSFQCSESCLGLWI
jgi:hypothetical protein